MSIVADFNMQERMKSEQAKFIASVNCTPNNESDLSKSEISIAGDDHVSEEAASVVCSLCRDSDSESPLSFLVLLQVKNNIKCLLCWNIGLHEMILFLPLLFSISSLFLKRIIFLIHQDMYSCPMHHPYESSP